jgi:hypothetical protein
VNGFEIEVTGDIIGVTTLPKQIIFATAESLTKTSKRAQKAIIPELERDFIIRTDWWRQDRKFGIKVKAAKKTDLTAMVYTAADWLLEAEGYHGGLKKPDKGGSHLADPDIDHTRHGIRNKVARAEKARKLLENSKRSKAFKIKGKYGGELIMQRIGLDSFGNPLTNKQGRYLRGRGKKRPSKVVLKYILRKDSRVPFHPVITQTTKLQFLLHFSSYFGESLYNSIRTAR